MQTVKEYYYQDDISTLMAKVVDVIDNKNSSFGIILDKTIFYPEGGGQPCDKGFIDGLAVNEVIENNDIIMHITNAAIPIGKEVKLSIDMERRIDHSEQHSAQHLLSSVLLRTMSGITLSFHLGQDYSIIDTDIQPLTIESINLIEDEILKIIYANYNFIVHECPPEDISSFPLRKQPKVEAELMRVVEIDGFEYSACCGTHVKNTQALKLFRIIKTEKYKTGSRIYFVAGNRALKDYRRLASIAREAAKCASTNEDDVPNSINILKDKLKNIEFDFIATKDNLALTKANLLIAGKPNTQIIYDNETSFDMATRLAKTISKLGYTAIITCQECLKFIACGNNVNTLVADISKQHNATGGGSSSLYQASFKDANSFNAFVEYVKQSLLA